MTDPAPTRPIRRGALVAVVTGAFVLRIAWLLSARPEPVSDHQVYVRLAESLLDRGLLGIDVPSALGLPGLPVLVPSIGGRSTIAHRPRAVAR